MRIEEIKTGKMYWMQGMTSETSKPEQVVVKEINALADIVSVERVATENFWECRPEYICNSLEEAEEADAKCKEKERAIAEAESCWIFLCNDTYDKFEVRKAHLVGNVFFPVGGSRRKEWYGRMFSAKRFYNVPLERIFLTEEAAVSYAEDYRKKKIQQYREFVDALEKQPVTKVDEG